MVNETTINIRINHQMEKSNVALYVNKSKYTREFWWLYLTSTKEKLVTHGVE